MQPKNEKRGLKIYLDFSSKVSLRLLAPVSRQLLPAHLRNAAAHHPRLPQWRLSVVYATTAKSLHQNSTVNRGQMNDKNHYLRVLWSVSLLPLCLLHCMLVASHKQLQSHQLGNQESWASGEPHGRCPSTSDSWN